MTPRRHLVSFWIGLGCWLSAAPGQQPTTTEDRVRARAAAVGMHELHVLRWGEDGLPRLGARTGLAASFTGDGNHLLLQVGFCHFSIDTSAGTCTQLHGLTGWSAVRPAAGNRVQLARDGGMAVATLPDGELEVPIEPRALQVDRGMIQVTTAALRTFWLAPDGRTVVASAPFEVHDLVADRQIALPGLPQSGWCQWSPAAEAFAIRGHVTDESMTLRVFDRAGAPLATFHAPRILGIEFDPDGKHVWWTGDGLHRGNLRTHEVVSTATATHWFWPLDPQLGLGLDGYRFQIWNLHGPTPTRELLALPVEPDVDAVAVGPPRPRSLPLGIGQVVAGLATASPLRDRIAVATPTGLRLWRLTR